MARTIRWLLRSNGVAVAATVTASAAVVLCVSVSIRARIETYVLLVALALMTAIWPFIIMVHRKYRALLRPVAILSLTLMSVYVIRPVFLLWNEVDMARVSPLLGVWAGRSDLRSYILGPLALATLAVPVIYVCCAFISAWPVRRESSGVFSPVVSVHRSESRVSSAPSGSVIALTVVGAASWVLYVLVFVGGFNNILSSGLLRDVESGAGYPYLGVIAFGSASLLWFCEAVMRGKIGPTYWLHLMAFAMGVLLLGSRTYLVVLLLSMLVAYYATGRRLRSLSLFILVLVTVTASTAFWFTRVAVQAAQSGHPAPIDLGRDALPGALVALEPFDFYVLATNLVPGFAPLEGGATYASTLLLPLKPLGLALPPPAGEAVTLILDPTAPGSRPPTFIGEGYLNFGLPGLLASAAILGIYVGMASRMLRMARSPLGLAAAAVVTATIPYLVWSYATAALVVTLNFVFWLGVLALVRAGRRRHTRIHT